MKALHILFLLIFLLISVSFQQSYGESVRTATTPVIISAQPLQRIPNGILLTLHSTLQAAEGELITTVGLDGKTVTPYLWQQRKAGEIYFVTHESGIHYQFLAQQKVFDFEPIATDIRVGVLSVTATNITQNVQQAAVFSMWRTDSQVQDINQGLLLDPNPALQVARVPYEKIWNPRWNWFFHEQGFMRDQLIMYFSVSDGTWDRQNWVRQQDVVPYQDLQAHSLIGFRRFSTKLDSGKLAALQFYIPYLPVEFEHYQDFAQLIHPVESKPSDQQAPQKRTQ
ncbi:MAG: hypothetical protein ACOX5R_21335 [bacterium]|jgi:hypothetical protein